MYDREDPYNPSNRRIDILVLTQRALHSIEGEMQETPESTEPAESSAVPVDEPSTAIEIPTSDSLNVCEEGVLQFDEVSN